MSWSSWQKGRSCHCLCQFLSFWQGPSRLGRWCSPTLCQGFPIFFVFLLFLSTFGQGALTLFLFTRCSKTLWQQTVKGNVTDSFFSIILYLEVLAHSFWQGVGLGCPLLSCRSYLQPLGFASLLALGKCGFATLPSLPLIFVKALVTEDKPLSFRFEGPGPTACAADFDSRGESVIRDDESKLQDWQACACLSASLPTYPTCCRRKYAGYFLLPV